MTSAEYLPRIVDRTLRAALADAPVVVLDGPRASGKTTTAQQLAASRILLPTDLPLITTNPDAYLAELPSPVLIDEWQLAGVDLLWAVKRLVDADPTPGRFLLTGSVEPATYGPTYPLTGRAVRAVIRPMTRAELTGAGSEPTFLEVIRADGPESLLGRRAESFDIEQLTRSGFPGARSMSDPSMLLTGYAATVAERAGDEGRDATRLLRTMRVLATLEGQTVPDQRIWQTADINKLTWKAYDDLLHRVHLAVPLVGFEANRLKRLTSLSKRFFADTAFSLALADVDAARLRADHRLAGAYLESWLVQQLRPQADRLGAQLSHLRTAAGEREVDVIVELGEQLFGFEVKHTPRPTPADARQLAWVRDELADRFAGGFVVHTGSETYPLGERLWAVPLSLVAGG